MRPGRHLPILTAGLSVLAAFWLGCGGGGADLAGPALGSLDITTSTAGPEPDPDGYTVSIDGAAPEAIAANATSRHDGLAAGGHTVELSGIAANCSATPGASLTVTVAANAVAAASFSIACRPTTGAIQVTTTAGTPADPDGYRLLLDGAAAQPIGTTATATLPGLAPGGHTVGLDGLADGCRVEGDNPLAVTVVAGQTAAVTLAVVCTPAPPVTGTLEIVTATTGPSPDPDGYSYSLDGGGPQPIGVSATVSVAGLAPGAHSVRLAGTAANCAVGGDNPRSVTVPEGGTVQVSFAVTCSVTTGSLVVTVTGLPDGAAAAVSVAGPGGFARSVTATTTLADLAPGSYTVTSSPVSSSGTSYTPTPARKSVAVSAGSTAGVTVAYAPAAGPSVNLRIDGWYLSQSVQSPAGDVPLVTNREAFLRVFVVADGANQAAPPVRVRLYRNGALATTLDIPAPSASTPTGRDEARLASSWNVKIPRALIAPGLALAAEVDPDNAIPEKDETDNSYPAGGGPQALNVRDAPILGVRFVPVRQQANGLQGDVTAANKASFLEYARRIHPLPSADGDVHEVYTTTTANPLVPDDANNAWTEVLSELDAMRVAEGTTRNYYGVVQIDYPSGIAGIGYIGLPTAMGYDRTFDRSRVMAHELGHNWGRPHSPCGAPGNPDPNYPYPGGVIGVYGFDLPNEVLKDPSFPDIMGYCGDPWISDYTYRRIMAFRENAASGALAASAAEQPCLLVWGRIVDGRAVLEPAFHLVTRPSLPAARGPYSVEGVSTDGVRMFGLSFDAAQVADDPRGTRHFAFAVPLSDAAASRLAGLRLAGPGARVAADRAAPPAAALSTGGAVEARRVSGGVLLRWDAAASPMIMVRDPDTGEVLSFARGGEVRVASTRGELDVTASDRVGSRRERVTVRP